jgi:hypothetical protein
MACAEDVKSGPAEDRARFGWRRTRVPRNPQLSAVLATFARREHRESATVGDLVVAMGDRAFGALLLCFALPNLLPIPGVSTVMAIPLIYVAVQLVGGNKNCRLPRSVTRRTLRWKYFDRLLPYIANAERILRPRLSPVVSPGGERVIGLLVIALAGILFLPIPLGNVAPAMSVAILGMALIQKDGVAALLGIGAAIGSAALAFGVVLAFTAGAWTIATEFFNP